VIVRHQKVGAFFFLVRHEVKPGGPALADCIEELLQEFSKL